MSRPTSSAILTQSISSAESEILAVLQREGSGGQRSLKSERTPLPERLTGRGSDEQEEEEGDGNTPISDGLEQTISKYASKKLETTLYHIELFIETFSSISHTSLCMI